ncbi:MAG: hypothetical protein IPM07_19485 [Anaerolineales bacterium]|nr:hypothetical protein [Anaerolineales bacterium]
MTNRPAIFAHRGARRVAPENTLPAFERALAMGVDGIEFDVHVTSDDRLVVIHDFTVEKTTNGEGAVAAMCEAEVRGLDAGSHFSPHFAGVQVPCWKKCWSWWATAAGLISKSRVWIPMPTMLRRAWRRSSGSGSCTTRCWSPASTRSP